MGEDEKPDWIEGLLEQRDAWNAEAQADPRDAEIARLRALVEQRTAERDVWSGEACREEQAAGNGPCGACRYCYPAQLAAAQAEVERLNTQIADWNDEGWPEWNRINESRQRAIIERMEAQADNAVLRAQNDCLRFNVDSFFRVWREYCEKKDEVDALTTSLADLQASADAYIQQTDPILDRVEVLSDERSEARRNLTAAQADNAALRNAAEKFLDGLPGWCGEEEELLRAALATPAPGAPLLDAVRGLVEAVERMTRREEFPANIGGPLTIHRVEFTHDAEGVEAASCHICTALAAVRAVLSRAQDTAGIARGGDG